MALSTQQSIPIAGVKDGIMILKDGSYRMVLEVSAVNFALKSEQEQNSLIFQYQSFLNSLHFPVEIVIRSRRLDLNPYLDKINKASETSINELIKMQIGDYVDFVSKLISLANIMKKTFYIVVPYDPINIKKLNVLDSLFAKTQTFDHIKVTDTDFKSHTDQLTQRAGIVASGLASMGLHCFQLSTEQIIELFYQIYNPDESAKERVNDANTLSSPVVIAKNEVSGETTIPTPEVLPDAIDNADMVEEQQRQAAAQRRQEADKAPQAQNVTTNQPVEIANGNIAPNGTEQVIQQSQQPAQVIDQGQPPVQPGQTQITNTTIQNNGQQ